MNKYFFDVISDIHIDQWDSSLVNLYPCGPIIQAPFTLQANENHILIVAGDVSDSMEYTLNFLKHAAKKYPSGVIFIDGNHEHVHKYPKLYDTDEIHSKISQLQENIVYLRKEPFHIREHKTVVIGACGWWDYSNQDTQKMVLSETYFDNWIPGLSSKCNIHGARSFMRNVIQRSDEEFDYLSSHISKYNADPNIDKIIVVTHTVPHIQSFEHEDDLSCIVNTKFSQLYDSDNTKLSHWIFGHTHEQINIKKNGVRFICNSRGRPEDFNRTKYKPYSFVI